MFSNEWLELVKKVEKWECIWKEKSEYENLAVKWRGSLQNCIKRKMLVKKDWNRQKGDKTRDEYLVAWHGAKKVNGSYGGYLGHSTRIVSN